MSDAPPRGGSFRPVLLAVLAVMVTLGACGDGTLVGPVSLVGRTFLSDAVTEGGVPRALVAGTRIRLTIETGRIGASAGCNTLGGVVVVEPHRIVVSELSTTEIGCQPALHDQDQWLADFLGADPSYTLEGDRLRLTSERTTIELIDRRVADPDRPLEGTLWQVDGIIDGDTVSSVPGQVVATLRLGRGRLAIEVQGCNRGGADVEVRPSELRVGAVTMTERACEGPPAGVEAAVIATLDGTVAYEIEAASLTLTNPSAHGLTLRAKEEQ